MKVHLVLPLALKSSYLAAIVILKLIVRNVYATVNLIVACFEDTSICGKLQLSFLSPVFKALLVQQGLFSAVVADVQGPWSEDTQAQPGFATYSCVIRTCCLPFFFFLIFFFKICARTLQGFVFYLVILNWGIIALPNCVGFCHTPTWINHRYSFFEPWFSYV